MASDNGDQLTRHRTYNVARLPLFGVEVNGIDLKQPVDKDTVAVIKEDVTRYRLVVFRGQGVVSAHRQVEISHWFGELDCPFYKHPASTHPEVNSVCLIAKLRQGGREGGRESVSVCVEKGERLCP